MVEAYNYVLHLVLQAFQCLYGAVIWVWCLAAYHFDDESLLKVTGKPMQLIVKVLRKYITFTLEIQLIAICEWLPVCLLLVNVKYMVAQ